MMSAQRSLGVDARRDLGRSTGVEDATMNLTDMTREKSILYLYICLPKLGLSGQRYRPRERWQDAGISRRGHRQAVNELSQLFNVRRRPQFRRQRRRRAYHRLDLARCHASLVLEVA